MSSTHAVRLTRRRTRHRIPALVTAVALAAAGLTVLAAPAQAAAGVTTAYIANQFSSTISVVNTATGTTTATIPVSGYPTGLAINAAGSTVYSANEISNTVSVIDTTTNTVTANIPVGANPDAIALNAAGTLLYTANVSGHSVSVIDTATATVVGTVPVPGFPFDMALNPAGTIAYVAGFNPNALTVINTASNTVIANIALSGPAYTVAVNPSGTTAYVGTAQQNTITTVDTATNTVTGAIAVPNITNMAFTPDGTKLLAVSPQNHNVTVIDPATGTITATVPTGIDPQKVAIDTAGTTAYVTDIVQPNGSGTGHVFAIDLATNTASTVTDTLVDPDAIVLHTVAAPVVTGISPNAGPLTAGTPVTITGTGLAGATAVTFGADGPATGVSCTPTSCTALAPAGIAGTVDVTVTTPGGTSAVIGADQYTYRRVPAITAITPNSGPPAGGTPVTITGTGLAGARIAFGTTPATGVSCTDTACTATTPVGSAGTVDVRATTAGGTSAVSTADHYTYAVPAPAVTHISPSFGDLSGGTVVTITGTDLLGTTAVHFGTALATSYTVNSDTQITATAPASAAYGPVDITVTTPAGTSAAGTADRYSYVNGVGKVTAAGRLSVGGSDAEFGFDARTTTSGGPVTGRLDYDNQHAGVRVDNATITVFYLTGPTTAHAEGTASCTTGGTTSACTFTVNATDNGNPGRGADTFTLTYNTTTVGGPIASGNVHVTPGTGGNGHGNAVTTARPLAPAVTGPLAATPATAAMTGGFSASLLGISLTGAECSTASLIYTDGTADGDTSCLLLGVAGINIDVNLPTTAGTTATGTATMTGTATVTVAGLLPVTLPVTEVLTTTGTTGLHLTVGGVNLPVLPLGTGGIQIG